MKKKYEYLGICIIVLIGIVLSLGVISAGKAFWVSGLPSEEPDAQIPKYLVYHERDNGISSVIHTRDIITIQLPENPMTGYQWDVSNSEGLSVIDDTYIYPDPSGRMGGEGGWRRFTLIPDTAGSESFSAVYKRSWDEKTGNEKTYSLKFDVV